VKTAAPIVAPDVMSPFGAYAPSPRRRRLLRLAQNAPRNFVGKQLARWARDLYLWRAPLPADVCVDQIRMRCYLRDNTGERKFVFTSWRFDPLEREFMAATLDRAGVFVDIGANVGIYTLTAALMMSSKGRVIALEPYPPAYQRLRFNIDATLGAADQRHAWPRIDALERPLPRHLIIENSEALWATDLAREFTARGYHRRLRTALNSIYSR
jgi:hypothetical protein